MRDGLLIVDDRAVCIDANESFATLVKCTKADLVGRHLSEFVPADRAAEASALPTATGQEAPALRELPLIAADGAIVQCEWAVNRHFVPGLTLCSARDVTDRYRQARELEKSEARFRAAASAASGLLWTNNAAGEMEGPQPGWANFTGQQMEEYQGYGWAAAVHPEDAQPTLEAWEQAVSERRTFNFEHRVRRHDGVYRMFSIRAVPAVNEAGAIEEWVGVHTDITEDRQMLDALLSSEARFRAMADSAPVLIWIADGNKRCSWFNKPWLRFRGQTMAQEIGFGWQAGTHPEDLERCLRIFNAGFDARVPYQVEYRLLRNDGEWRWVLEHGVPLSGADGSFAGYIGSCVDVTERRGAEEALRESEGRLRAIFDGTYEYIGLMSPDGTMLEANRAALEFAGSQPEDVIGRPFWKAPWVDSTAPEASEQIRGFVLRAAAGEFIRHEVAARKPSGELRRFDLSLYPVRNERGDVSLIVPEARDITEWREAEALLRDSEEGLRLAEAAAGIGIWEWDLTSGNIRWSPEIYSLLGISPETKPSLDAWVACAHPDDTLPALDAARLIAEDTSADGNRLLDTEFRIIRSDGEVRWLMARATVYRSEDGARVRLLGVNMDITAQKRAQQKSAFLVRLDDLIRGLSDQEEITQAAATEIGTQLAANRCIFAEVDTDADTFRVRFDYCAGLQTMVGRYAFSAFGRKWVREMMAGEPFVLVDSEKDPGGQGARQICRAIGIRAMICVPLMKRGKVVAAIAVHSRLPRKWRSGEVELMQVAASRCWESIEHARVEEELRHQRHTFDEVLSNLPDAIAMFDVEKRFTYANRTLLRNWRKTLEEITDRRLAQLGAPPDSAARIERELAECIQTGRPIRNEGEFTDAAGHTSIHEYIMAPVFAENGQVESVTCSWRDITERQRMEQELARSKDRLQQVFAEAPVAIGVFRGVDLRIELMNPMMRSLVQNRELMGRRLADAMPDLGEDLLGALRAVVETGEPFAATDMRVAYDREGFGQIEDHWFNLAFHPLQEASEAPSGVVVVAHEVTAQVRARQELERLNRELEEFAYVASHDLQEPLRMVNIFTDMLITRHLPDNPEAKSYAGYVQQGVLRMEKLIRDLLSYSRTIHSDGQPLGSADLNAALELATSTMQQRLAESGARLIVSELPQVQGDTGQLALVFQNLLSNALKYRRRDAEAEIRISAARDGEFWVIAFADNGIGFRQQYAVRIFGLFKRLHKDEYAGTGLGLAICQRVVERFGGRIWAEGREGEGSTFYVALREARPH
jgi:PAS domain S-box-containing protein